MFKIGQRVVFIGDYSEQAKEDWAIHLGTEMPETGGIYTVRRTVQRQNGPDDTAYGLLLEEILNLPSFCDKHGEGGIGLDASRLTAAPEEVAFNARDFRPLIRAEDFITNTADIDLPVPA